MGNPNSKSKERFSTFENEALDAKFHRAEKKLRAVRMMTGGPIASKSSNYEPPEEDTDRRRKLLDFVRNQKHDTRANYEVLSKAVTSEEGYRRYFIKDDPDFLANLPPRLEDDNDCSLCGKITSTFGFHPCRVCFKVFHSRCLEKSRCYGPEELDIIRLNSNLGWTCRDCADLCRLLEPHEVDRIYDLFEKLDIDRDEKIDAQEYLTFCDQMSLAHEGRPLTDEEKAQERKTFCRLDSDGNGEVEWEEFVNHEACQALSKRDSLRLLLSAKEIQRAEQLFSHYDTDKDGLVYQSDVRHAYRQWWAQVRHILGEDAEDRLRDDQQDQGFQFGRRRGSRKQSIFKRPKWWSRWRRETLTPATEGDEAYGERVTRGQASGIRLRDREMNFEQFLESQALYIISSRPNVVHQ